MKKRLIALAAACAMALSLAGCSGGTEPEPEETTAETDETSDAEETQGMHTEDTSAYAPYALTLAMLPARAQFPSDEVGLGDDGEWDFEAYNEAYDAWMEDQTDVTLTAEEAGLIPDFFARTAPAFLQEGDENFVYSPANIWFALSLLAEVTDGESRAQILDVLGVDSVEALREAESDIWDVSYRDDGASSAILANSLWLSDGMTYRQETLDLLSERYYASAFSGMPADPAYNEALRAWLNEQTRGLLEEQASDVTMDPDTILALASTIYYKASWAERFYEEFNTEETFHAPGGDQTVTFMHQMDRMPYYEGDGFRAAGLTLTDGSTMWFFLPDEGGDAGALLTDGTAAELLGSGALSHLSRYGEGGAGQIARLDFSVPRFDVDADLDLAPGMRELGITDVFDPLASDFTPLTDAEDEIEVSSAEHAARVKIDEEGVEAAAYTMMMVGATGIDEDRPIEFTLDRPFVFAITNAADVVLFAGLVNTVE